MKSDHGIVNAFFQQVGWQRLVTGLPLTRSTAMTAITVTAIPAFQDNYIWWLAAGEQHFVIDPGDATPVIARMEQLDCQLNGILITHHHWDHTGGVQALKARFPQVQVWGPSNPAIAGIDHALKDGEEIALLPDCHFRIISVPGHTLDHIAYFATPDGDEPILFCGDTLFSSGCGRLFEGTPAQMAESLARLAGLPDNTLVYCTHEYTRANLRFAAAVEPSNEAIQARSAAVERLRAAGMPSLPSPLSLEKAVNPFLRCNQPAVREQVQIQCGVSISTDVDVFTALRAWKDRF
jgi:hydroxyacylglutathione hydrolase